MNKDIFEAIYYHALKASCELAAVEGPYETYAGSPISKVCTKRKKQKMKLLVSLLQWRDILLLFFFPFSFSFWETLDLYYNLVMSFPPIIGLLILFYNM